MRVFYVIYVSDDHLRSILDTIRVLAAPVTSHPAHITVRGPYRQRLNVETFNRQIAGEHVELHDVSYFFKKGQHTVYLDASAPSLRSVWHKQDFEFNPHLTIYDGRSRARAVQLYQLLTRFPISAGFTAIGLEPLMSNGGQSNIDVLAGIDFNFVSRISGMELSADALSDLPDRFKDAVIERLCRYLSGQHPGSIRSTADEHETSGELRLPKGWSAYSRPPAPTVNSRSELRPVAQRSARRDPIAEAWGAWTFVQGSNHS